MILVLIMSSIGVVFVAVIVHRIYSREQVTALIELDPLDPRDIDYLDMDLCPLSPREVVGLMNFQPSPARIRSLLPNDPMDIDAGYLGITFPVTTLKAHTD